MIERLARYVGVRSLSRQEGELAALVRGELEQAGMTVRQQGANLWCEIGDAPRPRLLLNSHLDTVPPGEGWSADPWTLRREPDADGDERLIGLGANDAKGCLVAMIEAAMALRDAGGPGGTLVLALTAEEEISGQGLETILERIAPIDAAIVGEPTGLAPMIAQRGLLILKATARGRTSHPANTPTDETNAIAIAARDIARLRAFDWGPPHPLLGRPHAQATRIEAGIASNVVPDRCAFTLDVRTVPGESHGALLGRLQSALASELRVHSDRLVPVETAADEPIVRAALAALPGAALQGSRAMSDMVFLRGVPTVKIGPGASPRSHTPDEFVRVSELRAGAAAYERIARTYFASNPSRAQR